MCVLHIEHRIVIRLRTRQINIESELGIRLARNQEPAHCVGAGFFDQIAQGQITAGAFGEFDLFAAAHHRHHLVQHVVGIAGGNAAVECLQARLHPRQRAVVVGTQFGDGALVAALPFGQVVGHVRHEVGVRAVGLAHHPVLVVAKVGAAQPQRAAFFKGVALGDQRVHGLFHLAVGIQRRFEEVAVERHPKRRKIGILFAAQICHAEFADGIQVVAVIVAADGMAIHGHRVAAQVAGGHIGNVVAVIGIGRPLCVAGLEPLGARLHRLGQIFDLHTGIVVIELALHIPAVGGQHAGDAITNHPGTAVAHVQRTGGVGGHVFHADRLARTGVIAAKRRPRSMDIAHLLLPCGRRQVEVDEPGAGNLHLGDGLGDGQCRHQLLRQRAWIGFGATFSNLAGQQHGGIAGKITVRTLFRALDHEVGAGKVAGQGACVAQCGQALFDQGAELDFHKGAMRQF